MLPFQTEAFTPDDPDQLRRVCSGERLTGLYLGATGYLVDGVRWIVVGNGGFPSRGPWLAYPLPEAYGAEPIPAVKAFEEVWRLEANRMREAMPDLRAQPVQCPIPTVTAKAAPRASTKRPKPTATDPDAVPLPGLESWTGRPSR